MNVTISRAKIITICSDCGCEIIREQPVYKIDIEDVPQDIFLCEDCGNELQISLSNEYAKFVDLKR